MDFNAPLYSKTDAVYGIVDVLANEIIFVGGTCHPSDSPTTEFVQIENGIVVSHTVSIYAKDFHTLSLKLVDYVRNSQNEAE